MARRPRPWYWRERDAWVVQINGRREILASGKRNRDEAERRFAEIQYLASISPGMESRRQTVLSIVEMYLSRGMTRLAERTAYERRRHLQSFAEEYCDRLVSDCKPLHLTDWLANPAWKSDWTKASANKSIQAAFNWAVHQELIERNPFSRVSTPPGNARRPMTDDEFRRLVRATGSSYGRKTRPTPAARFRQLLYFLRFTGCRPDEAASLKWDEVSFDAAELVIVKHKTSKTQKVQRPRVVSLHPVVLRLLARIRESSRTNFVFVSFRGTRWNRSNLSLRIRRLRKKAGVPDDCKLYGLRHRFGTKAILNGVDLKTLAEVMGHTTTRVTEHYVHLAGQRAHLAAAVLRANAPGQDAAPSQAKRPVDVLTAPAPRPAPATKTPARRRPKSDSLS